MSKNSDGNQGQKKSGHSLVEKTVKQSFIYLFLHLVDQNYKQKNGINKVPHTYTNQAFVTNIKHIVRNSDC